MTNDETQRKMDFIVDQQAQFSIDIQRLKELHTQAEERLTRIEGVVLRLANFTENGFTNLAAAQTNLTNAQTLLDTRMAELAESQAHTEQKLNALIDIIRERNGGGSN
jgi:predicted  nucleic acid-binding Zn-ribbon protein